MPTLRRRPLRFTSYAQLLAEVDRLQAGGYQRAGKWTLTENCDHLRLLPERDPHDRLLGRVVILLDRTGVENLGAGLARFELMLLEELGFGLDLSSCAVTGATTSLTHVSPKSGRAVSAEAAAPYAERLLALPAFLIDEDAPAMPADIAAAFALTGFFLDRHVWAARGIDPPATRDPLVEGLTAGEE